MSTPAETLARAVRDNLADCLSTLPRLLDQERLPSLHFYFGNFHGMRKELFPALRTAYDAWVQDGKLEHLAETVEHGQQHWRKAAETLLERFRREGEAYRAGLEDPSAELRL